jgi:hypothetical protein
MGTDVAWVWSLNPWNETNCVETAWRRDLSRVLPALELDGGWNVEVVDEREYGGGCVGGRQARDRQRDAILSFDLVV